MPQDHTFGEPLTRTARMGYFHPPRLVGRAVDGASCHMHAMALIHLMALGDDPIPLEGRLYWDVPPGPRGKNHVAGQTHLGVRLTSGTSLAGLVRLGKRHRLTPTVDGDLTSIYYLDTPLRPTDVGDMKVGVVGSRE